MLHELPTSEKAGWPWRTRRLPKLPRRHSNWPRITIVTPSYNQGQFIEETIRSVLLQEYPNLEYMIIDGASTDETMRVVEQYRPYIDYVVSEPDNGQASAINKGLVRATGEIMGWLNSDDMLLPGALFRIANAFRNPDVHFVTGFRKVMDRDSNFLTNWIRDLPTEHYMTRYCCVAQETTYWRKSVWDDIGGINDSFRYALDYEYWIRAIMAGYEFQLIPQYIGYFRDYAENKSSTLHDVYVEEVNRIFQHYDIAIEEGDSVSQLGFSWPHKYQLIIDMCDTALMRFPRLVILALRLLENPIIQHRVLTSYSQATDRNYHGPNERGRPTQLQPISEMPVRQEANLHIENMLREETLQANDVLPVDGLLWGRNWYTPEIDPDGIIFRWAPAEAVMIATFPTLKRRILRMDIEPGPSVEVPFELVARNSAGDEIGRCSVANGGVHLIELSFIIGQSQYIHLHVEDTDISTVEYDVRTLCYFVREMGWLDAVEFTPSRLMPFVMPDDIVPQESWGAVANGQIPNKGIIAGHGWYPLEKYEGTVFRWAGDFAEIILLEPQDDVLELILQPGNYKDGAPIVIEDVEGRLLHETSLSKPQAVRISIRAEGQAIYRLYIRTISDAEQTGIDVRLLNFRCYGMRWYQPAASPVRVTHGGYSELEQRLMAWQQRSRSFATAPNTIARMRLLGKLWSDEAALLNSIQQHLVERHSHPVKDEGVEV